MIHARRKRSISIWHFCMFMDADVRATSVVDQLDVKPAVNTTMLLLAKKDVTKRLLK